jgi:hypothetical protein
MTTSTMAAQAQASVARPAWRAFFGSRGFVAAFLGLLVAAAGLNFAASYLQLHFRKEPVPLRGTFKETIPLVVGDWVQVIREEKLDADLQAALATDQYLFATYVNARALGQTPERLRREFADKSPLDQQQLLSTYRQRYAAAVLATAFTYYTGKADTVAHIPERCYVGDGFDPVNPRREAWGLDRDLSVRFITFENQRDARLPPYNVAYFFSVNGRYTDDSLAVRAELQNLFHRYGYYAKVELLCVANDREAAATAMRDFLGAVLSHVEAALPDWSQYSSGARP